MGKWFAPLCTLGLVIVVAVMSMSPALKSLFHTQGVLHPWLHLGIFTLLSCCTVFCSDSTPVRFLLLLLVAALGWGTEFREHLGNGFPIEQNDVLLDFAGVILGGMVGWLAADRLKAGSRD